MKRLQIFKPGAHTAMSGQSIVFSEADLAATARAYDPAKHEAPIVVGHPKDNAPAYGWVKSLAAAGAGLDAEPDQVDPAFAEMVGAGRFKKISASFYAPDAPANPVPGVYYLRHVGFLGAVPPAVKGLRNPEFAANEAGVVEFMDWDDMQNASLWGRLRDFLIAQFGLDKADQVIPGWTVDELKASAQRAPEDDPALAPSYTEPTNKDTSMTPKEIEALQAENARLKAQTTEFTERESRIAAQEAVARRTETLAFVEGLVTAGKVLPVHKDGVVAFLCALPAGTVVEFGEGDKKVSKPSADWLREYLTAQPKLVDFTEVGKRAADAKPVDPNELARLAHARVATAKAAGNTLQFAEAVAIVASELGMSTSDQEIQ